MTAPRPVTTARRAGSISVKEEILGRRNRDGDHQWSVAVVALEDDGSIVATEPDVVGQRVADRMGLGLADDPQVAFGVGVAVVDGRGCALLVDRLDGRERL